MADDGSGRRSHRAPGPATGSLGTQQPSPLTAPGRVIGDRLNPQNRPTRPPAPPIRRLTQSRSEPADPQTRPIQRVEPADRPSWMVSDPLADWGRPAAPPESFDSLFSDRPGQPPVKVNLPPAPPRPPAPPGRVGLPRLPLLAGSLAVLLVLAGIVTGLTWMNNRSSATDLIAGESAVPSTGSAAPSTSSAGKPKGTKKPVKKPAATVKTTGADASVKFGVFRGTSTSQVAAFSNWLGRDVQYASDFSSRDTWDEIADPSYMINEWRGSKYRMVYAVAMVPNQGNPSIEAGARGDYDKYYKELARNLVAGGQSDAILRLGWEFNLGTSHWSTPDSKAFIAYWKHIVNAMRSVPGGDKLQFDWNPNIGATTYDAVNYYPGSSYVDYIGIDVYDVSWTKDTYPYPDDCSDSCRLERQQIVWQRLMYGDGGLESWAAYAKQRGKPLALPEWGLWQRPDGHGGNDDPYFITQMYKFIDDPANNVAYQTYFEFDTPKSGQHELSTLPKAGKVFKKLFGE
jgi:hypothetical protein